MGSVIVPANVAISGTNPYRCLMRVSGIRFTGESYRVGSTVHLSDEEAAALLAVEAVVPLVRREDHTGLLPESFPAYKLLVGMGYTTYGAVVEAPDEELLRIAGIGKATLGEIRKAQTVVTGT